MRTKRMRQVFVSTSRKAACLHLQKIHSSFGLAISVWDSTRKGRKGQWFTHEEVHPRAPLVAQWWGIHLPGRETQVWSLAGRIPRARSSLQLLRLCSRAREPQLLKPERPSAHAPQEKLLQWEIPHDNEEQPPFATARERLCNSEDSAQTKISK